jgi:hypothetical protein
MIGMNAGVARRFAMAEADEADGNKAKARMFASRSPSRANRWRSRLFSAIYRPPATLTPPQARENSGFDGI